MFQNENWSSDEEYSQYLDDKAREFLSLVENEETKLPAKKRKLDNEQQSTTSNNKEEFNKIGVGFNRNQKLCFENTISPENNENLQSLRRKKVLDIFHKKNVQNLPNSSFSNTLMPTRSQSENIPDREKSKSDCNDSEIELQKSISYPNKSLLDNIVSDVNNYNEKSIIRKDNNKGQKELEDIEQAMNEKINDNVQDISPNSRKSLLMQHLKPSTSSSSKGFLNDIKSPSFFKIEKQSNKKTTLVRKFPGPAGLLPDFIDTSIAPTSYLINLEDNKDECIQEQKDNSLAKYCSQNTKTLFSEGAWQIMLNDLPAEFMKNYQIAEIKKIASAKQQRSIKIPFLAGIIESIDYSHENPPIVLKDFTDQIEGTLHADIPTEYPGAFDKNVVILLQNVGLLCVSGMFTIHKYHILISPSNLLAIYSHVGDIIRTPHMKLLKNKFSKTNEFNSTNLFTLQNNNCDIGESSYNNIDINQEDSLSSEKDSTKIYENQYQSHNSNIDISSSEKHSLPLLQTFSPNTNIVQNRDNVRIATAACTNTSNNISLQNIDKMTINKNAAGSKSNVLVTENKENLVKYNESSSLGVPTDASSKYFPDHNTICSDNKENNKNKYKLSGLEKLAIFKSKYVLPSEKSISGDKDMASENILQNNNNKFNDKQTPSIDNNWTNILCDSNNDSDDEMLSQLDVDSISAYDDKEN